MQITVWCCCCCCCRTPYNLTRFLLLLFSTPSHTFTIRQLLTQALVLLGRVVKPGKAIFMWFHKRNKLKLLWLNCFVSIHVCCCATSVQQQWFAVACLSSFFCLDNAHETYKQSKSQFWPDWTWLFKQHRFRHLTTCHPYTTHDHCCLLWHAYWG